MRVRIGPTTDEVEIGQYKLIEKGALKASFSIVIYPQGLPRGPKYLECLYFEHGENRWVTMPQKEIKHSDGRKSEYIPLVSYPDKEYANHLKIAVLEALKEAKPMETYVKSTKYGKEKSQTSENNQYKVRPSPPSDWEECPF